MDLKFLDFEQPIAELEAKIDELRYVGDDSEININEEVARLKDKSESLTRSIFAKLSPWQVARVARHESRPYTMDYLETIAPEFDGLDLVPLKAKAKEVHVAMSNAFGFGGVNACLVFRGGEG